MRMCECTKSAQAKCRFSDIRHLRIETSADRDIRNTSLAESGMSLCGHDAAADLDIPTSAAATAAHSETRHALVRHDERARSARASPEHDEQQHSEHRCSAIAEQPESECDDAL